MKYQEEALDKRLRKLEVINNFYEGGISINKIAKKVDEDWHFVDKVVNSNYKIKINRRRDVLPYNTF